MILILTYDLLIYYYLIVHTDIIILERFGRLTATNHL